MENPSEANDEGITALHNSICAGHFDVVNFLVEFGCDVNAADADGWYFILCSFLLSSQRRLHYGLPNCQCMLYSILSFNSFQKVQHTQYTIIKLEMKRTFKVH